MGASKGMLSKEKIFALILQNIFLSTETSLFQPLRNKRSQWVIEPEALTHNYSKFFFGRDCRLSNCKNLRVVCSDAFKDNYFNPAKHVLRQTVLFSFLQLLHS